MKRIFLILFLVIITASLAFSDGFLGSGNPTLPVIDALYGTTPSETCYLVANGSCGTPAGSLSCGANIPVLGTGQCGSSAITNYVLQSSLRQDNTGTNNDFIPRVDTGGNIAKTTIGPHLTFSSGNLDVAAGQYDPSGAANAITPTSLGLVIGSQVEAYDSTILKSASIGSTIQAYNAKLAAIAALANSSGQLTNDGSGNFSYTSGSVANAWVQGGLAPVSGKPLLAGTGANASIANITLQGTGGSTYNLDNMGGGNVTVAMAIGGNVTNGTPNSLLYVGANSLLAQEAMGANVLSALGNALNAAGGIQGSLGLVAGTMTNGYLCKYTAAGTLISCNVDSSAFVTGTPWTSANTSGTAGGLSGSPNITVTNLTVGGVANVTGVTWTGLNANNAGNSATSTNATSANALAGTPNISVTNFTVSGVANVTGSTWVGSGAANTPAINRSHGSFNIPTNVIGANSCANVLVSDAALAVNDVIDWGFGGDYTANVAFTPPNMLAVLSSVAGAGNVLFKFCNNTAANITPDSGMKIFWRDRL